MRAGTPSTPASTSRGPDRVAVDLSALLAPPHAALVANECQRGVIGDHSLLPELARAAAPVVPTIARLVAAARRAGVPVVHTTAVRRADSRGSNQNARLFMATRRPPRRTELLLPPGRRVAALVARPRPHPGAPVDEPRRRAAVEVGAGTRRDLDEREPREVGARQRAREVLAFPARRPRLELAELAADLRAPRFDRRRVALVGGREEHLPREPEEPLGEVEQALELLDADAGPGCRVGRQERRTRVALLQVLDDRARLIERDAVVLERRHLAVRAACQVRGRLVLALLEAEQHGLVGEPLLLERELDPPREGRARAVVEADHRGPPSP